jgi:hypothetical protein
MPNSSFSVGDFVRIVGSHPRAGQRGYVVEDNKSEKALIGCVSVLFDESKGDGEYPDEPPVSVSADFVELIRGDRQEVTTRVCDFIAGDFSCLGTSASSLASESSRINPDSPHGRTPRPPSEDLPGLHSVDKTFANSDGEAVFKDVYRGRFIIKWSHLFQGKVATPPGDAYALFLIRLPIYTLAIYPAVSTLHDGDSLGQIQIFEGPTVELCQMAWLDKFAFTHNQERHLAYRVIHHLLRVSGCDFGWTSLRAFIFLPQLYRDRGLVVRKLGLRDY